MSKGTKKIPADLDSPRRMEESFKRKSFFLERRTQGVEETQRAMKKRIKEIKNIPGLRKRARAQKTQQKFG